ncbi:hypothetical protein OIU85_013089 [Salix viminalis]|uniref:Protein kinase domain-containing protein n=1 Tax=Salix viminalis TaxID=40686 RepID=A0A9Q0NQM2_SALVM|nr:hypothetical protein OIU85_013089 [Salix viminalis]
MLSGKIPEEIGSFWSLKFLDLGGNVLAGEIPPSIAKLKTFAGEIPELIIKLKNLEILHLFSNNLTGKIPVALSTLPRLQVLQLWSNKLSGEIPKSLSACKSLQRIRLQENGLSGELPSEFTKLPLVYFLDISANKLLGRIDSRKWEMPSLQMLSLARNSFLGGLPDSFGSDNLENLDLSHNQFSGAIPDKFGRLSDLMQLNLSKNKLSGEIPDELSSCEKLVSLDLSQNKLSGQIPASFSEMPVLGQLDLSHNELSGEVPANLGKEESLVQVNISHNHFHGGLPSTGAFLAINASAVTGNNLCGGDKTSGLPPCRRDEEGKSNSELKRVENEDGTWELLFFNSKVSKSIAIEDIIISMKEENLISRGKKGASYKGKSITNNMQFILQKTNDVNSIPPSEVAELGKLHHPNVVKLFGLCRSNKVLVGYMSPEKIIIDGKDEPHLIASLPGLLCVDDNKCFISSAYAAPETRETKDISERSDMYGFGLVLIELLTGKCPADAEFGEHGSIVKWARYCYSDCHLDMWIDPMMRGNASINQNEMVETMNLALQCTATEPTARPCANEVSKTLESALKTSSCVLGLKFPSSLF